MSESHKQHRPDIAQLSEHDFQPSDVLATRNEGPLAQGSRVVPKGMNTLDALRRLGIKHEERRFPKSERQPESDFLEALLALNLEYGEHVLPIKRVDVLLPDLEEDEVHDMVAHRLGHILALQLVALVSRPTIEHVQEMRVALASVGVFHDHKLHPDVQFVYRQIKTEIQKIYDRVAPQVASNDSVKPIPELRDDDGLDPATGAEH